jgi:hypothetical protein
VKRKTLVETLQRDINRTADPGPDWPTILTVAMVTVIAQDTAWIHDQDPDITVAQLVGS